jgi:hypothetical protein
MCVARHTRIHGLHIGEAWDYGSKKTRTPRRMCPRSNGRRGSPSTVTIWTCLVCMIEFANMEQVVLQVGYVDEPGPCCKTGRPSDQGKS